MDAQNFKAGSDKDRWYGGGLMTFLAAETDTNVAFALRACQEITA